MLPTGAPALNRDEALEHLRPLEAALVELRKLRAQRDVRGVAHGTGRHRLSEHGIQERDELARRGQVLVHGRVGPIGGSQVSLVEAQVQGEVAKHSQPPRRPRVASSPS
jgi:hypothetical protein